MEIINFSNLEPQVLSLLNSGKNTFELLLENSGIGEKTLISIVEGLISKNILKFIPETKQYAYQTKVNGEMIILDGNLLLPCTVLKFADKLLVSRGEWYEFPVDFDIRRIIWNVKVPSKSNSTLVEIIRSSVLKEKKSRIIQLPEYQQLVDKIVPYSNTLGLLIHCIGENTSDVSIIFKIKLTKDTDMFVEHKGFKVRTEISTKELIEQLKKPVVERNFQENVKLNQIFNFSDFIYSQNEIPIQLTDEGLSYVKITGIKKGFELTYYLMGPSGTNKKGDVEQYDDSKEAIATLRNIFEKYPKQLLVENNFLAEMEE